MSDLAIFSKTVTMDSREIAQRTGKEHYNVMRDIREMFDALGKPALSFEFCYTGDNGKQLTAYRLPRRECLILATGYSVTLRASIIDRWEQLEKEGARLLSDRLIEKLDALQIEITDCKDMSDGPLRDFKEVAKMINIRGFGTRALIEFCREIGILYYRGMIPMEWVVAKGFIVHQVVKETRKNTTLKTMWTRKGIAWLLIQIANAGIIDHDGDIKLTETWRKL